jgi:hypothetical protein
MPVLADFIDFIAFIGAIVERACELLLGKQSKKMLMANDVRRRINEKVQDVVFVVTTACDTHDSK